MTKNPQSRIEECSPDTAATAARTGELYAELQAGTWRRTDLMFAKLMIFQWLAGIVAALWISPRTWIGAQSEIHVHVWAAIFIGGVLSSLPIYLAWRQPGSVLTRHVIAVAQVLFSALLIHLTGGRIETHFHIFGSLAFLAFYRDWKVLVTATVVVAADHFLRGTFWPQSVFGVLSSSPWRWVEHAGWVVFEDIFLFISIRESLQGARLVAERQARLEALNIGIEQVVRERTRELEESQKELISVSRQAGMAEVATNVLHNVGNVLNSVNISASTIADQLKQSRVGNLTKATGLLREHAADLSDFMTKDPKGQQLLNYLEQLAEHLQASRASLLNEVGSLTRNVDHIKDIVAMQQSYVQVSGVTENIKATELVEDALRMNASAINRHELNFVREYEPVPPEITVEKHKVLQILVNLICNAKQACSESGVAEKQVIVRVTNGSDRVRIALSDNGVGIPAENLSRIFNHGFSTKKNGHGFGLHASALAANELGGSLTAHSDGPGRGATFTLELPCHPKAKSA